jgi:predicted nucleic acid-binding protein
MKAVLDTNIYIGWIRARNYPEILLDIHSHKYLSSHVLMELWAGAQTRQAGRIVEKLQRPYVKAERIINLDSDHYITVGQILSDLPLSQKNKAKVAGFVNDICIGIGALSIGATLFTTNKADFKIIHSYLPNLKLSFV